jgi:hypothetical protein
VGRLPESPLEALYIALCERLGFCLSAEDRERITALKIVDVDDFTNAVLVAEGFDPPELCSKSLRRQLRAMIAEGLPRRPHQA